MFTSRCNASPPPRVQQTNSPAWSQRGKRTRRNRTPQGRRGAWENREGEGTSEGHGRTCVCVWGGGGHCTQAAPGCPGFRRFPRSSAECARCGPSAPPPPPAAAASPPPAAQQHSSRTRMPHRGTRGDVKRRGGRDTRDLGHTRTQTHTQRTVHHPHKHCVTYAGNNGHHTAHTEKVPTFVRTRESMRT